MNEILRKITKKTTVYFVRHGQSQYNANGIIAGRVETPLSELGIQQAEETGKFLKENNPFTALIYSPIGRATQTAKIIYNVCNSSETPIVLEMSQDLIELDAGIFESKTIVSVQEENPKLYQEFLKHSWEVVPKAEKISSLVSRAKKTWQKIEELSHKGHENITVVSHGGIMQWLFKTSFGFSGEHLKEWAPIIRVSNCSIFSITIEPAQSEQEQAQNGHATWNMLNYTVYKK